MGMASANKPNNGGGEAPSEDGKSGTPDLFPQGKVDMPAAYAWADLVICRAGAMTVAEIAFMGVASVLIPFPYAVDDHQSANAAHLVKAGAAVMLPQSVVIMNIASNEFASVAGRKMTRGDRNDVSKKLTHTGSTHCFCRFLQQ